jgi:hypothetical protein
MLVPIDAQHDVVKQRAQQLLAITIAGCLRAPYLVDLAGETAHRPPLRIGQRRRPLPVKLGQRAALPLGLGERLLPGSLQRSGDEPVLRFARIELPATAFGFELGALKGERLHSAALRVLGFELVDRGGGRVNPGGVDRVEERLDDRGVQSQPADRLARPAGCLHLVGA